MRTHNCSFDGGHVWQAPPSSIGLDSDDLHLWRINQGADGQDLARLSAWLSPDELARAGRFRFDRDRRYFVRCHAAAREILSKYLNTAPGKVAWAAAAGGKPYVEDTSLQFNLSHASHLAVIAISWGRELGVDIEEIRHIDDLDQLAASMFAKGERELFQNAPAAQRQQEFFRCWTRTEALLKAQGGGIASLDRSARLMHADDIWQSGICPETDWHVYDFQPHPGFCGALVVRLRYGECLKLELFDYN